MRKLFTLLLILSLLFIHANYSLAQTQQKTPITKQKTTNPQVATPKKVTSTKSAVKLRKARKGVVTASRSESLIAALLRRGTSVTGAPYSFGSTGPRSFDCSGFTAFVYKAIDIELPHSSAAQADLGKQVSKAELAKGDLIIFNDRGNSRIGHVGIYVGDNNFIHASTSKGVTITSLSDSYYQKRYAGSRRILQ